MSNFKAKVNAKSLDLSSFVVSTLVQGLKVEAVPVNFDVTKKDD